MSERQHTACQGSWLCRVARVVAWLEDLAGQDFDRCQAASDAEGGSLMYFGETQGLPLGTCHGLRSKLPGPRQGQTVSELDPDASTRQAPDPCGHVPCRIWKTTAELQANGAQPPRCTL